MILYLVITILACLVCWYYGGKKEADNHIATLQRYDATLTKTLKALELTNKYLCVLVEDWESFDKEHQS